MLWALAKLALRAISWTVPALAQATPRSAPPFSVVSRMDGVLFRMNCALPDKTTADALEAAVVAFSHLTSRPSFLKKPSCCAINSSALDGLEPDTTVTLLMLGLAPAPDAPAAAPDDGLVP